MRAYCKLENWAHTKSTLIYRTMGKISIREVYIHPWYESVIYSGSVFFFTQMFSFDELDHIPDKLIITD